MLAIFIVAVDSEVEANLAAVALLEHRLAYVQMTKQKSATPLLSELKYQESKAA